MHLLRTHRAIGLGGFECCCKLCVRRLGQRPRHLPGSLCHTAEL